MSANYFYIFSVIILVILLYIPVNKMIYILSVRRLSKKMNSNLSETQLKGQLNRSRFITIILLCLFSCLFNFKIF